MTPDRVMAEARGWIGTPYRQGASLRGFGCDCLGFVLGVHNALCAPDRRETWPDGTAWRLIGVRDEKLLEALDRRFLRRAGPDFQAGDLIAFRWRGDLIASHLAIATGPETMIHAHSRATVAEIALSLPWRRRLVAIYSFAETL